MNTPTPRPPWHFVDFECVCLCVSAPDEVTMEEVGQAAQLRAGELIIIVVVLVMWAGTVPPQQRTSITTELGGIHRVRVVFSEGSNFRFRITFRT